MKTLLALLAVIFTAAALCFSADELYYRQLSSGEKQSLMEQHYREAMQYYSDKNYSKAIYHWEEILKIDPDQKSPVQMIELARKTLSENTRPAEEAVKALYEKGKYRDALDKANYLLEIDSTNSKYKALSRKLEHITALVSEEAKSGKLPNLIRLGIIAHLTNEPNPKLALNALQYARDINPEYPGLARLFEFMKETYPDTVGSEQVAPGMNLVEHKLFVALNHIYEGRYDLSIFKCNEVLQLEPQNLLALKRKGSAYYALGQKQKAREIWQLASKYHPDDSEIKKFLKQAK